MSFLGIDVGTTGCKIIAFTHSGQQLARAYREYPLLTPRPGWVELDPDHIWNSVAAGIREVAGQVHADPPEAMAVSSLGEACLPISADGQALANSSVSFDMRALAQWGHFADRLSADAVAEITGLTPLPHYALFKLMWWREHQPEVFERAWKFVCFGDFIGFRLGVGPVMDHTMAARTLAFDVKRGNWSSVILDAADLPSAKLPQIGTSGSVIGEIASSVAIDLDLPRGVKFVLGGLDQACAALGAGVIQPSEALLSLGTSGVLGLVPKSPTHRMSANGIITMPHIIPGTLLSLGGTMGGGSVLRWYRDQLGSAERETASRTGQDAYDVILATPDEQQVPVLVLPHLAGSRFAFGDPTAMGAVLGLTLETTRGAILRALLEGVAYEFAIMHERFEAAGLPAPKLHAVGGGAQSDRWLQLIADTTRVPIWAMQIADAAALGASLLCTLALGQYPTPAAAVGQAVRLRRSFEPNRDWAAYHAARLVLYRQAYASIKDLAPQLRQVNTEAILTRSEQHDC